MKAGIIHLQLLLLAALLAGLTGCRMPTTVTTYQGKPVAVPEPVTVTVDEAALRRARILADMLYAAKSAFDDNRLMVPAGNNAYEQYQQVLQVDPGNAQALAGIQEIAVRYIALAETALSQAEYTEAETMLARATRLNPAMPELAVTTARLAQARQVSVQVHALDAAGLRSHSLEIMTELAEVAQQIKTAEATFLIRARTDEEGRWIYKTMRDAVGGYRLRGNIAIAGSPAIVINTAGAATAPAGSE
jgi:tetratricopeptide (TPR) repeat protein